MEPSPRAIKFVPRILLPLYGWDHQSIPNEKSFRQTINGQTRTDRGFMVQVAKDVAKVVVSFNADSVADRHSAWLSSVEENIGLKELDPQPYWGFDDLKNKAGTKLLNCFFIGVNRRREAGIEYFRYEEVSMLREFSFDRFLTALEDCHVLVDFDARTGHNHGTKFRIKQAKILGLYDDVQKII